TTAPAARRTWAPRRCSSAWPTSSSAGSWCYGRGSELTMEALLSTELWMALLTLSVLEIVLGVDNLVFISIAVGRLPSHRRSSARRFGLALACITRILLLVSPAWLARMSQPIITAFGSELSIRDLVLIGGGLFLLVKG